MSKQILTEVALALRKFPCCHLNIGLDVLAGRNGSPSYESNSGRTTSNQPFHCVKLDAHSKEDMVSQVEVSR